MGNSRAKVSPSWLPPFYLGHDQSLDVGYIGKVMTLSKSTCGWGNAWRDWQLKAVRWLLSQQLGNKPLIKEGDLGCTAPFPSHSIWGERDGVPMLLETGCSGKASPRRLSEVRKGAMEILRDSMLNKGNRECKWPGWNCSWHVPGIAKKSARLECKKQGDSGRKWTRVRSHMVLHTNTTLGFMFSVMRSHRRIENQRVSRFALWFKKMTLVAAVWRRES